MDSCYILVITPNCLMFCSTAVFQNECRIHFPGLYNYLTFWLPVDQCWGWSYINSPTFLSPMISDYYIRSQTTDTNIYPVWVILEEINRKTLRFICDTIKYLSHRPLLGTNPIYFAILLYLPLFRSYVFSFLLALRSKSLLRYVHEWMSKN